MAVDPDLIATYFTLAGNIEPFDENTASPHSLVQRAQAASRAGYAGIGFSIDDIEALLGRHDPSEIRSILDDNGLPLREFEVLVDWYAEGQARAESDARRRTCLDAAEKFGAFQLKVAGDLTGRTWPTGHIVEEFAKLCDEASGAGLTITIELFPTSALSNLQSGRSVVEGADRTNGGLLLDIWHIQRGLIPIESIANLPKGIVNHVELDDGSAAPDGDFLLETIHQRLLPGEGEFPLNKFIAALKSCGYDGNYGVEILSNTFRTMDVNEAAQRSADATRSLFG